MSEDQKDQTYGRLAREVKRLDEEIVYLRVELNRIGTNLEVAGRLLKLDQGPITLDRESADLDVGQMFDLIAKYNKAIASRAEKQGDLDKLG